MGGMKIYCSLLLGGAGSEIVSICGAFPNGRAGSLALSVGPEGTVETDESAEFDSALN